MIPFQIQQVKTSSADLADQQGDAQSKRDVKEIMCPFPL